MAHNNKKRFRNLCFTLNNYTDDEYKRIVEGKFWTYLCVGKEIGEDNSTPHLQGYLCLRNQTSFSVCKNLISPRAHLEPRKGTHQEASDYCKKDGDFVELGTPPQQGKRNDIHQACKMIKEGSSLKSVATELPEVFVKYGRGLRALKLPLDEQYNQDRLGDEWSVGPQGSGR